MRLTGIITGAALLLVSAEAAGQGLGDIFGQFFRGPEIRQEQPQKKSEVKLDYNVHFDYAFVNNEFDASRNFYIPSGTIAAARVTPYIGAKIDRGAAGVHRLMGGIDILKNFGDNPIPWGVENDPALENKALFREITMWYQYDRQFGKTAFTAAAGAFPRFLGLGKYSTAVFSDRVRFFDNNAEGLLLKWKREKSGYEVMLDWNGLIGVDRREQFNILTYGECHLIDWLQLGWQGMFHHYASCKNAVGVVDDHFLNPFIRFDLAKMASMQALSISAGPFIGYQRDRRFEDYTIPMGLDLVLEGKKWNVGLRYEYYYGDDMMPLFGKVDAAGIPFATNLYTRSGVWRISTDGTPSYYQNAELYWTPPLGEFIRVKLSAIAHMNREYLGWQQLLIISFDLGKLGQGKKVPKPARKEPQRSVYNL